MFLTTLVDDDVEEEEEEEVEEEKVYRPNIDVSICHHCKTGFRDSNNVQCGETGKTSGFPIMKYP